MTVGKKERIIWISLVTVIFAMFMIAMLKYQAALTSVTQRAANLEQEKTVWSQEEVSLKEKISELTAQTEIYARQISAFPDSSTIEYRLKQQGFEGSVQDIVANLIKHPELIPYEGVLGGKMGFYNKDEIYVLTDQWVCAYFDDGHISGSLLLGYKINNGAISWEMMDSCLYD